MIGRNANFVLLAILEKRPHDQTLVNSLKMRLIHTNANEF